MEERQSRLSSTVWRRFRPYLCVRLIIQNSMFSNFCHVLKSIILCFSQIYCYRNGDDKKRSYIDAIKKSLYGIYFAGMMLIIWILVMISIP